jgi:sensor c-di-GMP phosphodiesterase-like protein
MNRSVAITVALLAGLLAIAAPILIAIDFAKNQSLDAEMNRALAYARDVLHRSDRIAEQIYGGIDRLVDAHLDDPCSDAGIALMRRIALDAAFIEAIGRVSGDRLVCSSFGRHGEGLDLGPVETVTKTGSRVRTNVGLPFGGETRFTVIEREGYAAVIHKTLPIDASTDEDDVSLATFTPESRSIRSSHGFLRPGWIDALQGRSETTFFDGEYVVAVAQSGRFSSGAVAALPVLYLNRRMRAFTLMLVPIGVVAGIALSLAVLYLARLQLSFAAVLKTALRRKEIFIAYQPIVDLGTGRWVGAEALIRWRRPNGEVVRPDLFIPAAEDNGLGPRITERVIDIVTRDAPEFFRRDPQFHIGVNLSSADIQSRHTIGLLKRLAREADAQPHNLLIEATERGFLNTEIAREVIREIRALGIRVAIDDFGTGYSSLAYLQTFELDFLKIDKSFVDTLGTEAATSHVVLHIIEMAKALGLEMIAEGVETESQAQQLRDLGVGYAQGWLFGRPMSAADLARGLGPAASARKPVEALA